MENKEKCVQEIYSAAARHGVLQTLCLVFGSRAKIRLGFSKAVCLTPIEELSLSVRGLNVLKRNGINTLGEAVDIIRGNLLEGFRNLGEKTAREIKTKIILYGYDALNEKERKEFLADIIALNVRK